LTKKNCPRAECSGCPKYFYGCNLESSPYFIQIEKERKIKELTEEQESDGNLTAIYCGLSNGPNPLKISFGILVGQNQCS
jgi:hypothetical protein